MRRDEILDTIIGCLIGIVGVCIAYIDEVPTVMSYLGIGVFGIGWYFIFLAYKRHENRKRDEEEE